MIEHDDLHARAKAILGRLHGRQSVELERKESADSDRAGRAPSDRLRGHRSEHDAVARTAAAARPTGFKAAAGQSSSDTGRDLRHVRISDAAHEPSDGNGTGSRRLRVAWTPLLASSAPPDPRLQPPLHHA